MQSEFPMLGADRTVSTPTGLPLGTVDQHTGYRSTHMRPPTLTRWQPPRSTVRALSKAQKPGQVCDVAHQFVVHRLDQLYERKLHSAAAVPPPSPASAARHTTLLGCRTGSTPLRTALRFQPNGPRPGRPLGRRK